MKGLILTAKHHDGFCLWPSRYTEHSVKNSPWRDGQRRRGRASWRDACREYGLEASASTSRPGTAITRSTAGPRTSTYYRNQLRELLTGYGPRLRGLVRRRERRRRLLRRRAGDAAHRQPHLLRLAEHLGHRPRAAAGRRDVQRRRARRPLGRQRDGHRRSTPRGTALDRATSTRAIRATRRQLARGSLDAATGSRRRWTSRSARAGSTTPPRTRRSRAVEDLLEIYYSSVGRGANLLLNIPPDRRGLIPEVDAARLREFRRVLDATFRTRSRQRVRVRPRPTCAAALEPLRAGAVWRRQGATPTGRPTTG